MWWQARFPFGFRVNLTAYRTCKVVGVNSDLLDGKHALFWDFDGVSLTRVREMLIRAQRMYRLPDVYIFQTRSIRENYHAYCLERFDWPRAVSIVAGTPLVDWTFVRWAVFRGHFTLRIGVKDGHTPWMVKVLESDVPEDIKPDEFEHFPQYETKAGKYAKT